MPPVLEKEGKAVMEKNYSHVVSACLSSVAMQSGAVECGVCVSACVCVRACLLALASWLLKWDSGPLYSPGVWPTLLQSVEAAVLLPEKGDFSQLGVKKQGLHFVTAGSKGERPGTPLPDLEAEEGLYFRQCMAIIPGMVVFCVAKALG